VSDIITLILVLISLIMLTKIHRQLSLPWMATPGGNMLPPGLAFERHRLLIQLHNVFGRQAQ